MTAYGLNAEEAGFVLGARLFAQFFSGPLWGGIADKTRKHKFVLLFQIAISSILTFAAPWMPLVLPEGSRPSVCHDTLLAPQSNGSLLMTTGLPVFSTMTPSFVPFTAISKNPINTRLLFTEDKNAEANMTTKAIIVTSGLSINNRSANLSPTNSTYTVTVPPASTAYKNSSKKNTGKSEISSICARPDTNKLFILMIIWFALIGAFDGGIPLLIDNAVLDTIEREGKSDFGKQRLWGAVGFGLAAFASGVGIELSGQKGPNYFTMFYIFLGSNICLVVCCCLLKMGGHHSKDDLLTNERKKKPNLIKGLVKTFKRFNVTFFFFTVLVMGIANGLLYGFMFLFIQDLKGSKIIMGLSILVACSTEVMMFPVSNKVIRFLRGNLPAITLGFALYVFRFAGFSLLQNAWYILLLQLSHSICFALFWNAAVYHTADLAPEGMQATLFGIMNGVFFGFAGAFSSIVGGIFYNHFGGRNMFRGYAIICAVWTLFLILHIIERKMKGKLGNKKDRDAAKKEAATEMDEDPTSANLLSARA